MEKNKKLILRLCLFTFLFFLTGNLLAQENFEKDSNYDIYFESAIVREVRIINIVTIGKEEFLVITGTGFNSKEKKGYIRFDCIKAILLSRSITAEKTCVKDASK